MRLTVLLALLISFCCQKLQAQNLVPNPSFEDMVSCPLGGDQLYKALNWYSFRYSPDYFHTCCISANCVVGVPNNDLGFQYPHSGNAYAGIITYDLTGAPYREYLAVHLTSPTQPGTKYYVSFFVSWSGKIGFTIANNKMSIAMTDSLYSANNPFPITNNPVAFSNIIYDDSTGWSKVLLEFVATNSDQYLIIGNLFDDTNTDTLNLGIFNQHAYYYIDDVCMSTDSVYCSNYTGINEFDIDSSNILNKYFVSEDNLYLFFNSSNTKKTINIFRTSGEHVSSWITDNAEIRIPLKNQFNFYFVQILTQNKIQTLKLINTHK